MRPSRFPRPGRPPQGFVSDRRNVYRSGTAMPHLRSISVARYRSFARQTTLELRPLTLIYGSNSAGKSALLRLLPLLADSVREQASSPLDLSGLAGNKAAFRDILWKGPVDGHRDLEVGLRWDDAPASDEVRYVLRYSEERKQALVEEMTVLRRDEVELVARRVPESRERERSGAPLLYEVVEQGRPHPAEPWKFEGLVPWPAGRWGPVTNIASLLVGLRGRAQWIQSVRRPPERRNPDRGGFGDALLHPDGKDACHALRSDDGLRASVSAWYEAHAGRLLELLDAPPSDYRVVLRPQSASALDVDLVDAGEGFAQVFPVLTALALARRRAEIEPFYFACEEPESHLHSDNQVALAGALGEAAASPSPPITVIETHSFQIMLSVQLAVARRNLPADRVIVYWVEQLDDGSSIATRVTLDEAGYPEGAWPPDRFADQRRLATELQRVRAARPRKETKQA